MENLSKRLRNQKKDTNETTIKKVSFHKPDKFVLDKIRIWFPFLSFFIHQTIILVKFELHPKRILINPPALGFLFVIIGDQVRGKPPTRPLVFFLKAFGYNNKSLLLLLLLIVCKTPHLCPIFSRFLFMAKSVCSESQNWTNASPDDRPLESLTR